MSILHPEYLMAIPFLLFVTNKKNFLFSLSALFLILALSGIAKKEIKEVKIPNRDIFLLIDTTYSMACEDLKPDRLEYAKKETIKLIKQINRPIAIFSFAKGVHLLSLPTTDKKTLIRKILPLKPQKARTDIAMALNRVKYASSSKKTVVLISDGGEKKIKGDFIFWGFATKKGAKVPNFSAISRLNIIGGKFFSYKQTSKLIKYLNSQNQYTTKKIIIYKPISYIFVILAFVSFLAGVAFSRFKILIILFFLFPHQAKANDMLGCFYEYLGLKQAAFKEFRNSDSDFSKMKTALYYLKHGSYKKALRYIEKVKNYPNSTYIKALILTKLKRFDEAYRLLQGSALKKESLKLYIFLKTHQRNGKSTIFPITKASKNTTKKEPLW